MIPKKARETAKEVLEYIDHFEKQVPFSDKTADKLSDWFDNGLRCCCVPYVDEIGDVVDAFDKVSNGKFSFLYPDHSGWTTLNFLKEDQELEELCGSFSEIELVAPIQLIKQWDLFNFTAFLLEVQQILPTHRIKMILQTPLLEFGEIMYFTDMCVMHGIKFVKTGTGYYGLTLPKHISWMSMQVRESNAAHGMDTKSKAAGRIRTHPDMIAYIDCGADIIGTSSTEIILKEAIRNVHGH